MTTALTVLIVLVCIILGLAIGAAVTVALAVAWTWWQDRRHFRAAVRGINTDWEGWAAAEERDLSTTPEQDR